MPARKAVGRASELLTGTVVDSRLLTPPLTGSTLKDDAYYDAKFKAARPAILLYLNGKGPRPEDFWLWHAPQDRTTLRRLHARGIVREDPRYIDALIEAVRAGDSLSKKEMKDLAEHVRAVDDLFYPAAQNRSSELSAEAQALGRTVGELHTEKTTRRMAELDNLAKANRAIEKRTKELQNSVEGEVNKVWDALPRRQKTVNNITKILCNPKKIKNKPITPNMEHWKYRWSYKNKRITTQFWTLYDYVDDAVKALKAASA